MKYIIKACAASAVTVLAVAISCGTASATNQKVTLCHNGHTIEISVRALDGHFDHEGQPAVGHETDYLGECVVVTPPTTVPPVEEPPVEEPPVVVDPPVEPPILVPPVEEPVSLVPPVVVESGPSSETPTRAKELPRTGTELGVLSVIGAGLVGAGAALLRKRGRLTR